MKNRQSIGTMYIDVHRHSVVDNINNIAVVNISTDQDVPDSGYYSIGIHPWNIDDTHIDNALERLKSKIDSENIIAIGETGLDRCIETSIDIQLELFKHHISLAQNLNKPLIIHCVRAFSDIISVLNGISVPVIIHGYRGNKQILKQLLDKGFYISFGSAVLNNTTKLNDVIKSTPINRLFLETDDSGVRIEELYDYISKLIDCSIKELSKNISLNFNTVFY